MAAKRRIPSIEVAEIQRGVLAINSPALQRRVEELLSAVPHTSDNECIYLSRENASYAAQLLIQAGITALSLEMEIHSLRFPPPENAVNSSFGNYCIADDIGFVPDHVMWKRFSYRSRCGIPAQPRRVQSEQWSLFLREGQLVVALGNGHFLGYYVASGKRLIRCKAPQEELEACHWRALPTKMYFEAKQTLAPYVALYDTPIWLPPQHYDLLYKRLTGVAGRGGGDFVLIHRLDLPLAEQILKSLGIELIEGTPPEKTNIRALEIVETAAHAAQQAYAAYLKSEVGAREFEDIVQACRWEQIEPPAFREMLADLANRAYIFEPLAEELLSYLIDRLPCSFDWKSLRDSRVNNWMIQGIVLDVDVPPHFGPGGSKYYKVIVQELGLVLGAVSKRNLLSSEGLRIRPAYFLANSWRVTPYAGRLKFTGADSSVVTELASRRQIAEEGLSYIYGIPSIEARLARELHLSAFFLDRDAEYWRGHNEFSRYFAGYGKLIEKAVSEFDEPSALFQDAFGYFFYLRFSEGHYPYYQEFLPAAEEGKWYQFVAHVGLRSILTAASDLPTFDLGYSSAPCQVELVEVAEAAVLGILRYYGQLGERALWQQLLSSQIQTHHVGEAIARLIQCGRIVQSGKTLYYGYPFCSPAERVALADVETMHRASISSRLFYLGLRPFLPMIHPLGYESSLCGQATSDACGQLQKKMLKRADKFVAIVARNNYQTAMSTALEKVKQFGVFVFRVHPWNREYAAAVARFVRDALPFYRMDVRRKDVVQLYEGRDVPEMWIRISSPDIIARLSFAEQLRRSGIARRVVVEQRRGEQ